MSTNKSVAKKATKKAVKKVAKKSVKPKYDKAGAPTLYKESHCQTIIDLAKGGMEFPKQWAVELGVGIQTMRGWKAVHDKFSEAYDYAMTISNVNFYKEYNSISTTTDLGKFKWKAGAVYKETEVQRIEQSIEGNMHHDVVFDVRFADRDTEDIPFDETND